MLPTAASPLLKRPAPRSGFCPVQIYAGSLYLAGELTIPSEATGIVVIGHESAYARLGDGSRTMAMGFHIRGLATLVVDLLSAEEEVETGDWGDVERATDRMATVLNWLLPDPIVGDFPIGLYACGPGGCGPACLIVAADRPEDVAAVAIRCGRPDRAGRALGMPLPPTLLIVDADHVSTQRPSKDAFRRLRTPDKRLELLAGASMGVSEMETLDEATLLAADWFASHLPSSRRS